MKWMGRLEVVERSLSPICFLWHTPELETVLSNLALVFCSLFPYPSCAVPDVIIEDPTTHRSRFESILSFRFKKIHEPVKNAFYLLLSRRRKTRWIRTINPDNWRHLMDFCGAGWGSSDNTPSSVGLGERKYNCAVLQMRALDIKTSLQWGYRKT